jgi:hypothetical protein
LLGCHPHSTISINHSSARLLGGICCGWWVVDRSRMARRRRIDINDDAVANLKLHHPNNGAPALCASNAVFD